MSSIQILAPDVAAKIAAGEVVERPASIVKELIENAIDAGATRITVDLQGGGTTALRITDNGRGVAREELPLVFARHGTSKLRAMDDFEALHTLGFRGEALASVGSVAAVTFASRTAEAEAGARLEMLHGQLGEVVAHAMPGGTIVTVRDLFAHVPARLKFLKSRQGEAGYCVQVLERYALAYPEIAFTVQNEGRLALRTPGDGTLTSAIAAVYDLIVAEGMVDVAYGDPATVAALPLLERPPIVRGMTSRPAINKSNKQHMHLFVNRRWVRSQSLGYAIEEAYHSLLLTGRHPISVINIALDPALLDVNVHPAKTEVKFARERQVYAAVQRAVRAAIIDTTAAPVVSSGAFTVIAPPAILVGNSVIAHGDDESEHEGHEEPRNGEEVTGDSDEPNISPAPARSMTAEGPAMRAVDDAPPPTAPRRAEVPLWNPNELRGAERPLEVRHTAATPPPPKRLPVMRVLGQMSGSYIITEGPDGMYMIDQHAAHERILLEKMVAQWRSQSLAAQALLEPVVVELPPDVYEAVEERLEDLRHLGFDLEPFGAASLMVRAVPAPLASHASADGLADLLPDLVGGDHVGHAETWEEHALANIACRAAIKAGKVLAPDEQRELVRQLEAAGARHSCCHGRPTTIHLSLDALEREFGRR